MNYLYLQNRKLPSLTVKLIATDFSINKENSCISDIKKKQDAEERGYKLKVKFGFYLFYATLNIYLAKEPY